MMSPRLTLLAILIFSGSLLCVTVSFQWSENATASNKRQIADAKGKQMEILVEQLKKKCNGSGTIEPPRPSCVPCLQAMNDLIATNSNDRLSEDAKKESAIIQDRETLCFIVKKSIENLLQQNAKLKQTIIQQTVAINQLSSGLKSTQSDLLTCNRQLQNCKGTTCLPCPKHPQCPTCPSCPTTPTTDCTACENENTILRSNLTNAKKDLNAARDQANQYKYGITEWSQLVTSEISKVRASVNQSITSKNATNVDISKFDTLLKDIHEVASTASQQTFKEKSILYQSLVKKLTQEFANFFDGVTGLTSQAVIDTQNQRQNAARKIQQAKQQIEKNQQQAAKKIEKYQQQVVKENAKVQEIKAEFKKVVATLKQCSDKLKGRK